MSRNNNAGAEPPPEFSVEIDLGEIGRNGGHFKLAANEHERREIAKRLKTPSVEKLEGVMRVSVTKSEIVIAGALDAELTRECVASLEPMTEHVAEDFDILFLRAAPESDPVENEAAEWTAPEVHEANRLDIGELLVQQLALAMAPFPRRPDAESLAERYGAGGDVSPFAGLAGLVSKPDKNQ